MVRPLSSLALIAAASLVLGSACGGDDTAGDSTGGSAVTAEEACASYAAGVCGRIEACAGFFLQTSYGSVATCEARLQISCGSVFDAEGVGTTPEEVDTCAGAVSSSSCEDLLGRVDPSGCEPTPGTLGNGEVCGIGAQCQSGHCNTGSNTCGVCAAEAGAGASCTRSEDCGEGLVCAPDLQCVAPGKAGDGCSTNQPCVGTLACKSGTCATPGGAGAACAAPGECDAANGFFCGASGVCATIGLAGPGEPCGIIDGQLVVCRESGRCKVVGASGTCLAHAEDGAACDLTNGPDCLSPARCIGGACTIADPASCN